MRTTALELSEELPPLTERQARVLIAIHSFYKENRYYPTHRELAGLCGVRSAGMEAYLRPLRAKGYVAKMGLKRNSKLTPKGMEKLALLMKDADHRSVSLEPLA